MDSPGANDTKHVMSPCEICKEGVVSGVGFRRATAPLPVIKRVPKEHVRMHGKSDGHAGNASAWTYPVGHVSVGHKVSSGIATKPAGHSAAIAARHENTRISRVMTEMDLDAEGTQGIGLFIQERASINSKMAR